MMLENTVCETNFFKILKNENEINIFNQNFLSFFLFLKTKILINLFKIYLNLFFCKCSKIKHKTIVN